MLRKGLGNVAQEVNHCFNPQGDGGREGHMVRANAVSHWGRNEDLISHPVSQHFAERIGPLTVGDEGSVGAVLLAEPTGITATLMLGSSFSTSGHTISPNTRRCFFSSIFLHLIIEGWAPYRRPPFWMIRSFRTQRLPLPSLEYCRGDTRSSQHPRQCRRWRW